MAELNRGVGRAMTQGVAAASLRGVVSLSGSQAMAVALQFAAFAIMVASLGPSQAGVYTFAIAFTQLFQFGTDLGLGGVALRDVAQRPEREQALIPNLLYMRVMLGALAYGFVAALIVSIQFDGDIRAATLAVAVVLVLLALESFLVSLRARLRMGPIALGLSIQAVVFLAGVIVLSAHDAGVLAFVWLYVATNVLRLLIVSSAGLRLAAPLDWRPRPTLWRSLTRTALPVAIAVLLTTGYGRFDTILLGGVASAADVGQYGVAYRFLDTLGIFAGVVATVVAPIFARSWAESTELLARRVRRSMRASLAIALPVSLGGAMTAWRLVPSLPGLGAFEGAGVALSILSPAFVLIFLGHQLDALLIAGHQQRRLIWLAAAGLAVNIAVTIPLAVAYSYVGAAVATLVTQGAVFVAYAVVLRRSMGISLATDAGGRLAAACAVMAGALALGYAVSVWLQLVLGIGAYLVVALGLRVIDWNELKDTWRDRGGAPRSSEPSGRVAP